MARLLDTRAAYQPLWLAIACLHWPLRALSTKAITVGANDLLDQYGNHHQGEVLESKHLHLSNHGQVTEESPPLAVADQQYVCACNSAAEALGVSLGMPSAVAASLLNKPLLVRDGKREAALLDALCEACYSITPYVINASQLMMRGAQAGVVLEVSRCQRLFKGSTGIAKQVRQLLQAFDLEAHWAWAHTAEAAWLLSQAHAAPLSQPPAGAEQAAEALAAIYALPITSAEALADDIERLQAMGFSQLGELCRKGESFRAITKRLSPSSIDYLEALLGGGAQGSLFQAPPAYYQPTLSFCEGLDAEYPIATIEWLQTLIDALLQQLTAFLVRHQYQVQHLQWRLYSIRHDCHKLDIHLERMFADATLAADITRIHLEQQGLPFEVDRLELQCVNLQPLQINSQPLWEEPTHKNREALARLSARLQGRMGDDAFFKVSCADGILPEACMQKIPVQESACSQLPEGVSNKHRPMWLIEPPEKIHMHNGQLNWQGVLEIISEPERIQTGWWQQACARDYYVARRDDQQLLWLYQDLHQQSWYVHGVFG